jgi:hypothetical protein
MPSEMVLSSPLESIATLAQDAVPQANRISKLSTCQRRAASLCGQADFFGEEPMLPFPSALSCQ